MKRKLISLSILLILLASPSCEKEEITEVKNFHSRNGVDTYEIRAFNTSKKFDDTGGEEITQDMDEAYIS